MDLVGGGGGVEGGVRGLRQWCGHLQGRRGKGVR